MRNYSRQLDTFIESKPYANSAYKETDSRTWVGYYHDQNGMIHSNTFNYSIIGRIPVTEDDFKKCIENDPKPKVSFV